MRFITPVKVFILIHKFIFIGLTITIAIAVTSIIYLNNTKTVVLGIETKATPTLTPKIGITQQPVISLTPSIAKTQSTIKATTFSPTSTPTPLNPTSSQSNNSSSTNNPSPTANQPVIAATDTPVPTKPAQESPTPQSSQYVVNGVTFSSQYPTVSLKPGEKKTVFTMKASGNKNFEVIDFRIIGSNGLGLSEMSGSISVGQTKEILLTANPDASPGTYSGFIGVKIDGAFYDQPLRPTVIIEGNGSENSQVLRLTGPSAGSSYNQGDKITITWEATNISGDFSLSIEGNSGDTYSFANVPNSERSYTWEAKKWFAPSATNFRFTISGGGLIDHSDGDIIIN